MRHSQERSISAEGHCRRRGISVVVVVVMVVPLVLVIILFVVIIITVVIVVVENRVKTIKISV